MSRPSPTPQHLVLSAEEDLRVLAVGERLEARVGPKVRRGPLPDLTERAQLAARGLPLELGREPLPGPAREGVRLLPGDVDDRVSRLDRCPAAHRGGDPPFPAALPVHRRPGPGCLDVLGVGRVGDRGSVDLERGQLDLVPGPLVVVGKAPGRRADRVSSSLDGRHLRSARLDRLGADRPQRLVAVDHLQQLQHRLVVLVLVREQHLVDEAFPQKGILGRRGEVDGVEHLEGALADVGRVGAQLGVAQDRQLPTGPTRVLDRVVEAAEISVQRLAVADRLHQPELLEVGDMAEVPGQGTEQRRVHGVELLVVERLDQLQGARSCLGESFRDRSLGVCRHLGGDTKSL